MEEVSVNSESRIRRFAEWVDINPRLIWRALKEQLLSSYHIQHVQYSVTQSALKLGQGDILGLKSTGQVSQLRFIYFFADEGLFWEF